MTNLMITVESTLLITKYVYDLHIMLPVIASVQTALRSSDPSSAIPSNYNYNVVRSTQSAYRSESIFHKTQTSRCFKFRRLRSRPPTFFEISFFENLEISVNVYFEMIHPTYTRSYIPSLMRRELFKVRATPVTNR